MRCFYFFSFAILTILFSCQQAPTLGELPGIVLSCSTSEQSKTAALSAEDEVGLFAAVEGTEDYFMENAKWVVGSDGHTLTTTPAAYYPQERQAIRFYAYFPLGGTWSGTQGSFSVPTDQSTAAPLKQADLCWATAGSTPVATPVALEFEHLMARLVVQANQTPTQLAVPNVVTGGVLHVTTGALVLGTTRSELNTTGSELILPAQPLTRLLLTVSGVVYVYEGAIPLEAGKTTTLNLTLNPSTHTATLAGSSITAWGAASAAGDPDAPVNNTFMMHYAPAPADYAKADKITLTVQHPISLATQDIDLVPALVVGQSSAAACGYTFALQLPSASGVPYPYVVSRVRLYAGSTVLRDTPRKYLKGSLVYRSGAQTLAHYITIKVRDEVTRSTEMNTWENVSGAGEQRLYVVDIIGADGLIWTATTTDVDLVVSPGSSKPSGTPVAILWRRNPSITVGRSGSITFETQPQLATLTIPTNQLAQATPPNTIMVNGVAICTGNLVADGNGGCKIGAPTDYGLYFQYGSLIGYSGGVNGDGTGTGTPSTTKVEVKPIQMTVPPEWRAKDGDAIKTLTDFYFNYSYGYQWMRNDNTVDHGVFDVPITGDSGSGNLRSGRYAALGVGDPCTYYLGTKYRTPIRTELNAVFEAGGYTRGEALIHTASGLTFSWVGYLGNATNGAYYESGSTWRGRTTVGRWGVYCEAIAFFRSGAYYPFDGIGRSTALPVRCVSN